MAMEGSKVPTMDTWAKAVEAASVARASTNVNPKFDVKKSSRHQSLTQVFDMTFESRLCLHQRGDPALSVPALPASTVAPIDTACSVRLDMLPQLAGSLAPLIEQQPVAVYKNGQVVGYFVGGGLMQQLAHAPAATSAPAPALAPTGGFELPGSREVIQSQQHRARQLSNQQVVLAQLAQLLLAQEEERTRRGALAKASLQILRNRLDRHILPCLGHVPVHQIDADSVQQLVSRLTDEEASPTTLSQYLVIVRKLLKLAHSRRLIAEMPDLPSVQIQHKPRANFNLHEYAQLLKTAKRLWRTQAQAPLIKTGMGERTRFWITPKNRTLPPDLYWVIGFMVNAFVRPTDIKVLKHRHVQVIRSSEQTYLRLTLPETKKHDKPIVSLRPAVRIYEAMQHRAQKMSLNDPDDYVFMPHEKNREQALAILNFWLKWVMREARLPLTDNHGHARTLYSLRHTAITFRLLYGQGIDMLTLARNARTSVDMIENFYASTLTGEMNVDMLQSRRTRVKSQSA